MKLSGTLLSGLWVPFWVALGQVGGCGSLLESCRREQGCAGVKEAAAQLSPVKEGEGGPPAPCRAATGLLPWCGKEGRLRQTEGWLSHLQIREWHRLNSSPQGFSL